MYLEVGSSSPDTGEKKFLIKNYDNIFIKLLFSHIKNKPLQTENMKIRSLSLPKGKQAFAVNVNKL